MEELLTIPVGSVNLEGDLVVPEGAYALVLFAHGSGSSRFSPRNRMVAQILQDAGIATLLVDLLTREEEIDYETRFDITLLTDRLLAIMAWIKKDPRTKDLSLGLFGSSTGAAAALYVAAKERLTVQAVVSRGGRPDLSSPVLDEVHAPTLLIVGGDDTQVLALNRHAYDLLKSEKELSVVHGATHLFEESGALEHVADLALQWFKRFLISSH